MSTTTCIICDTLNVQSENWLFDNEANDVLKKKKSTYILKEAIMPTPTSRNFFK
jgi:hypothetical protein